MDYSEASLLDVGKKVFLYFQQRAQEFSREFWISLFELSCDLDMVNSLNAILLDLHNSEADEEALNLLYAMNLFSNCEMRLPVGQIEMHSVFVAIFMTAFLEASEEDIAELEDTAILLYAEMTMTLVRQAAPS